VTVKTDGRGRRRDYKKEYNRDHASEAAKKDRACRNKAHARHNPPKGREVDHKKPLSKGGKCGPKNERVTSRKTNRKKGAK
jgi:hypothetical protein